LNVRLSSMLLILLLVFTIVELVGTLLGVVSVARLTSIIGKSSFYMVMGILVYSVYSGRMGVFIVGGLGLTASTTVMLKTVLDMPRPPQNLWLTEATGPGFPSGHAAMSISFAILVWRATKNRLLASALLIHAFAVSYSRIVLMVHYPLDVVGGLLVGIATSILSVFIYDKIGEPAKYLFIVSIPSLLASIVASYYMPSYSDTPLLTGFSAGALLVYPLLLRMPGNILESRRKCIIIPSVTLGFLGLGLVVLLERTGSYPLILIGGALLVIAVVSSRLLSHLLVCRNKGRI